MNRRELIAAALTAPLAAVVDVEKKVYPWVERQFIDGVSYTLDGITIHWWKDLNITKMWDFRGNGLIGTFPSLEHAKELAEEMRLNLLNI